MAEQKNVKEVVFDLSSGKDLTEIERICSNPGKFKVIVDETITLPFRHMRYEVL